MPRVCKHLDQNPDAALSQFFGGIGLEYALVCTACRKEPGTIERDLIDVSVERFAEIEEAGCWEVGSKGVIGRPEVRTRDTTLAFRHEHFRLTKSIPPGITTVQPIPTSRYSEFLLLTENGELLRIEPRREQATRVAMLRDSRMTRASLWALRVSADGEFAAVVEDKGRYGLVFNLGEGGRVTMQLDRGDYYPEQTIFPAAFFTKDGTTRLVRATDWNRLDISDPTTGKLLTGRSPTAFRPGEERPEHDLNYFHAGLAVSPKSDWIVDNGWGWHPCGVVASWSLRRWLEENCWESEDGPSRRELCYRTYYWDGPLCWVDDRTVAVWGYGNDDENLIPAALLFDVETGRRLRWFPGPEGTFAFDGRLISHSAEAGTSVWDVQTGERLLRDPSFCPTVYHPGGDEFITIAPDQRGRLSRLVDSRAI